MKKKQEGNGYEPYVMTPEEVFADLDRKGIKYEICDTPIPVLENKVNCGSPKDSGEQMIDDYYYVPKSVVGLHPVMDMPAQGDSMIDADIHEGDLLRMEIGAVPHDGDIVLAEVDREYTAKVFFTDDQQQKWLLPMNEKYSPILLTADKEPRITGVVRSIVKEAPSLSYRDCAAIVVRHKRQRAEEGDVFTRVKKAVSEGSLLFWASSSWAVVYCVARDCCGYEGSMKEFEQKAMNMVLPKTFEHVCSKGAVQRTISNHPYMRLPIDKWKENGASLREVVLKEFLRKLLL